MAALRDALQPVLPDDAAAAVLAGRVWRPDVAGPSVVALRDGELVDVSAAFPTTLMITPRLRFCISV